MNEDIINKLDKIIMEGDLADWKFRSDVFLEDVIYKKQIMFSIREEKVYRRILGLSIRVGAKINISLYISQNTCGFYGEGLKIGKVSPINHSKWLKRLEFIIMKCVKERNDHQSIKEERELNEILDSVSTQTEDVRE